MKNKTAGSEMFLFFVLAGCIAMGNGLGESVLGNYYKEVYNATAFQRGLIEMPRELPGMLCAFVMAGLSALGDFRISVVGGVLGAIGLVALGLFTPSFGIMLIFLFVFSLGQHLYFPLQESICMQLAEPTRVGARMGQFASVRSGLSFLAALLVFIGFRAGFFSLTTPIKSVFLLSAAAYLMAAAVSVALVYKVKAPAVKKQKFRIVFRKQYRYYYMLTILHGVQKQIAFVYGTWVVIDMLRKGADTIALLFIASHFISIFFMQSIGRWVDKFGIKTMMFVDALTFIGVYILYGFVVLGVSSNWLPRDGIAAWMVYALFVMDRLSMQISMVKSVYLRSIARRDDEVTATLSTGLSLDHAVTIVAAVAGGYIWSAWGSHWVFFMAAFFSLGNLVVAWRVRPEEEREQALEFRRLHEAEGNG